MKCPKCGSENVFVQQIQTGSTTKTKTKHYAKHHSLLYWLLIGWWIWLPRLVWDAIWAICTLGLSLFIKKKSKVGVSKGKEKTSVKLQTVCTCQSCGKSWNV